MTDTVHDINKQLAAFQGGKVYMSEGSYADKAAVIAAFADLTDKATELSTNYQAMSDLAEDPGSFDSTVEILKSMNYTYEGKRSNVLTLNLVGVSAPRKEFLEKDLNSIVRTIVLESHSGKDLMILNGLKFVADTKSPFSGLTSVVIKSEFGGATDTKIIPIVGLVAG